MARLLGDEFVSYFERHLDTVEARWGKERKGRSHMVWWFAWEVRNACSHNWKISIKGRDHLAVQWRGLIISHRTNNNGSFAKCEVVDRTLVGCGASCISRAYYQSNSTALS